MHCDCDSSRAVWVDLTGDGRKSILTARDKLRKSTTMLQTKTVDQRMGSLFGWRFQNLIILMRLPVRPWNRMGQPLIR
jgi:hypothetical protein